jgi:hypothetical protein
MYFFERLTQFDLNLITAEEVNIMLIGYVIVFTVLAALYIVFLNVPRGLKLFLGARDAIKKIGKKKEAEPELVVDRVPASSKEPISGAVNAAITAAIHLYINDNYHDDEDAILTIQKVSRRYSPWSSKIYSVTNYRR